MIVESPLPGGVAAIVRFFFHVPQWIQIGGAVLGVIVALLVLRMLWRRRRAMWSWVAGRPRNVKLGLGAVAGVLVLAAAAAGSASWNYMQHDNGFCTGCHVMSDAFTRFTSSEHDSLSCHDCHQQSLYASARQMYLWVLERPDEIGAHAGVPNARCEACHVTGQAEVWQRIASTAGHRTHLESDSVDLADVQCITCHGVEVHRFAPVDQTCAQSGCHINSDIAIGPMQNQTALHCATCHAFTAEVPLLATRDSAAGRMRPADSQCFSCHEMRAVLESFDPVRDPHAGTCGMCHNPHTQETAAEAGQTCTSAGCHGNWRVEPFHTGANHRRIGEQCLTCHEPHRASVDASDCAACHQAVIDRPDSPRAIRDRLRRALPFDTAVAARRIGGRPQGAGPRWAHVSIREPPAYAKGDGPPPSAVPAVAPASIPAARQDTFPHDRHEDLTCTTCHTTNDGRHGLVFEQPRGCLLCHHQDGAQAECAPCHADGGPAASRDARVTVTVASRGPATHAAVFDHAAHHNVPCGQCHTTGAPLAVTPAVAACRDCHDDHHAAERRCDPCHVNAAAPVAHAPPVDAHVACDACHATATVERLAPDRPFCATCHVTEREGHYAHRECTTCHMLASPEAWRRHLRRAP